MAVPAILRSAIIFDLALDKDCSSALAGGLRSAAAFMRQAKGAGRMCRQNAQSYSLKFQLK
jgi:hypothetical protein